MADRFETDLEPAGQLVDVVTQFVRRLKKLPVRQQQRAGKIVRQTDPRYLACLRGELIVGGQDGVESVGLGEQGQLGGHLKGALAGM